MKKKKSGAPQLITRPIVERICRSMAKGTPKAYACAAAGVKEDSFDKSVQRHPEFDEIRQRFHGEFIEDAVERINAGVDGWQSKAWILERRYRPHFNRTENVAQTTPDGSAVLSEADMLELEKIAKALVNGQVGRKNAS